MTATETPRSNGRGKANTTVIRAAATRIQLGNRKVAKAQAGKREEWQIEAFGYYDDTGILKSVLLFRANLMAKVRLFPAVRPLDDPEAAPIPATDPDSGISPELAKRAQAEIARIVGESGGTPEILRLLDLNNELAGECYIVGKGARIKTETIAGEEVQVLYPETWDVRSVLEVEVTQEGVYKVADPLSGTKVDLDPMLDTCVRVWQRHPGYAKRADCHVRAILTDLEALLLLTNEVKAESKSRQSNGLLFIPNTMSVSTPTRTTPASEDADPEAIDDYPDDEAEPAAQSIGEAIEEAMLDPIEDPGSPYSVLRTILVGPPDDGDKIKPIDLDKKASEKLEERIEARKRAIAQGLPMPVEVAEGLMQTTFANAAQVDEDIFEKYLEPACVIIADMWTIGLLQPALMAGTNDPNAERIIVWYDPKQLLTEVDPVEHITEARAAGAIGNEAVRRYYGFAEDDAPEPIEMLIDAILKQRTWDPGLVDAVVRALDPGLELPTPTAAPAPAALVASLQRLRDEGPTSDVRGAVLAGLADLRKVIRASAKPKPAMLSASEKLGAADAHLFATTSAVLNGAMTRALQKAGNRLKGKAGPIREQLRLVAPEYAAHLLGPKGLERLRAELAGLNDEDLIDADAFDAAVAKFNRDAKHTQEQALAVAAGLAGLSAAQKRQLAARQAAHLNDASLWMRDQLHELASERLFNPDDTQPPAGEFDPDARVPAGLVRYAMAVAGGATALAFTASNERDRYVATAGDKPMGGVATGELIQSAITSTDTMVIEGFMWDYGEAFRQNPYEPHEELDGTVAESALDFGEDDFGPAFPGNHDGCACGPLIPVYAEVPASSAGPAPVEADLFGEGD